MVLDTGASSVVLTQEAAKAAGLPLEDAELQRQRRHRERAHARGLGDARARRRSVDRREVGARVRSRSRGSCSTSLLGMSFLHRLERWEVRGERLVHARVSLERSNKADDKAHATSIRKMPKAISSCRCGSACATRAP